MILLDATASKETQHSSASIEYLQSLSLSLSRCLQKTDENHLYKLQLHLKRFFFIFCEISTKIGIQKILKIFEEIKKLRIQIIYVHVLSHKYLLWLWLRELVSAWWRSIFFEKKFFYYLLNSDHTQQIKIKRIFSA